MKQYEVTFIVDPVLSGDEIKATAKTYVDMLEKDGCTIVHIEEMGLRQLAYQINRRTSGIYYCVEYQTETGAVNTGLELAMKRDERILRFLTAKLEKYGIKYNDDKRNGLIGKVKKKVKKEKEDRNDRRGRGRNDNRKPAPAPKKEAAPTPAPVAAPVVEKEIAVAEAPAVTPTVVKEEE